MLDIYEVERLSTLGDTERKRLLIEAWHLLYPVFLPVGDTWVLDDCDYLPVRNQKNVRPILNSDKYFVLRKLERL